MKATFITITMLTLITISTSETLSQNVCSKLTCGGATSHVGCAKPSGAISYTLWECPNQTDYCPYLKAKWDGTKPADQQTEVTCEAKKPESKSYPGQVCSSNSDCIYGTCNGSVCVGKAEGEECEKGLHHQCELGLSCYFSDKKFTCRATSPTVACLTDYDCPRNYGCSVKGEHTEDAGNCIPYFSLENGAIAPSVQNFSFCKSGLAVKYDNGEYHCASTSLKLNQGAVMKECTNDEECVYTAEIIKDGKKATEDVSFEGSCDCGYNVEGKKYCRLGNQNIKEYDLFTQRIRDALSDYRCHTEERFSCSYILKNQAYKLNSIEKMSVESVKAHKFFGSGDCIKKIVSPQYDANLIYPKCPKFITKETKANDVCVESNGYNKKENYTVEISKCGTDKICSYNARDFFNSDAKTNICTPIDKTARPYAYPGEKCSTPTDCFEYTNDQGSQVKDCVAGVCAGQTATKTCTKDADCVKGLYCQAGTDGSKCQNQINDEIKKCSNSYQCTNDRICFAEKCMKVYSRELGTKVLEVEAAFRDSACASGYQHNGYCAELRYGPNHFSDKGLVKCNYGDICTYVVSLKGDRTQDRFTSKECSCGYNAEGQGYCPFSIHDVNKNRQKKIKEVNLSALESPSNHTRNRKKIPSADNTACLSVYENSAYTNAIPSIFDVIVKGKCETIEPDQQESSSSSGSGSATSSSDGGNLKSSFLILGLLLLIL